MNATNSFDKSLPVQPMKLLRLIEWAEKSEKWFVDSKAGLKTAEKPANGVLALPPLQRTAVWTPKKIIDLWDSVLRGLPIGSIYLKSREIGEPARWLGSDAANNAVAGEGLDLLDGQQRLRTLLLGIRGPCFSKDATDQRCLWVEHDKKKDKEFRLRLTTVSQPFGYDPETGTKMSVEYRRNARLLIEPIDQSKPYNEQDLIKTNTPDGLRIAYNHELFEGFEHGTLESKAEEYLGWQKGWPPLPYSAGEHRAAYPLHFLLGKWIKGTSDDDRRNELAKAVPDRTLGDALHKAFGHLRKAEVAIITVSFLIPNDLLLLFERIGDGGTPLEQYPNWVNRFGIPESAEF
jgi:hypothetical protein